MRLRTVINRIALGATLVALSPARHAASQTPETAATGMSTSAQGDPNDPPPPYVAVADDMVEYGSRSAIAHIAKRWAEPRDRQVVIAHFGDSHVQKGYITEAARRVLEDDRGYGGRGMVFPYAIAKTYSQNDFSSTFTGVWKTGNSIQQPPRIPVGVSGFAASTSDPDASVTLTFRAPLDPGPKRIRILYSAVGSTYDLTVESGEDRGTIATSSDEGGGPMTAVFDLAGASGVLNLQAHASHPGGTFTLRGISVENSPARGVLYHNLGVGGAVYQALLQQTWFEPEERFIRPDLVILDWGTNDLLFTDVSTGEFEQTVLRTIAKVRRASPEASILLASPQDMTWHGRDVEAAAALSTTLRRAALQTNCLYWDWYRIAGGIGSSARWRADGLMGSDGVHLTSRGYRLKGHLLGSALLRTLAFARTHGSANAFEVDSETRLDQTPE